MANLDPLTLPSIEIPDGPARGEYGAHIVDTVTMLAVVDAVEAGDFVISPHWESAVADATDAELEAVFGAFLSSSPLSAFASALAHRRLALITAIKTIGEAGARVSTKEVEPVEAPRLIGDLEIWMQTQREALLAEYSPEDLDLMLADTLLLPAKTAARLLSTTEPTLSRWRAGGTGPAFVQIGRNERGIRYPYIAVRSWLIGLMENQ